MPALAPVTFSKIPSKNKQLEFYFIYHLLPPYPVRGGTGLVRCSRKRSRTYQTTQQCADIPPSGVVHISPPSTLRTYSAPSNEPP